MAKRSTDLGRVCGFLCFFAIMVSGIIFGVTKILELFGETLGFLSTVLFIAQLALLIAVTISGYVYLQSIKLKNRKLWTILFWVFVVLAFFGILPL